MTKFETVEGPKTREKVTVWMGLSNHGVFGSHFFENEDEKADTIRTANYIAMLRGEVLRVIKRKQKRNSYIFNKTDPPHCSHKCLGWLRENFGQILTSGKQNSAGLLTALTSVVSKGNSDTNYESY